MLQRPPSRRSRHAQWQRDYRARERTGVKIAPAPYDGRVVDFLVHTQWRRVFFRAHTSAPAAVAAVAAVSDFLVRNKGLLVFLHTKCGCCSTAAVAAVGW